MSSSKYNVKNICFQLQAIHNDNIKITTTKKKLFF